MQMMRLRPSDIRFSQAEINNRFDKNSCHRNVNLGETLDDLVQGRCCIKDIPMISVMKRDGKWVTADNRRLWVFRHLEKLGKCETIPVRETWFIDSRKLNSDTDGRTVRFYSGKSASGFWHSQVSSIDPITLDNSTIHRENEHMLPDVSSFSHSFPISKVATLLQDISLSEGVVNLDPQDVRYTKETISVGADLQKLSSLLSLNMSHNQRVNHVTVYHVFKKYWVVDGNKRLWAFQEARKNNLNVRIRAEVKEDKNEFLEIMRKDRPWLSLTDIMKSGRNIEVI